MSRPDGGHENAHESTRENAHENAHENADARADGREARGTRGVGADRTGNGIRTGNGMEDDGRENARHADSDSDADVNAEAKVDAGESAGMGPDTSGDADMDSDGGTDPDTSEGVEPRSGADADVPPDTNAPPDTDLPPSADVPPDPDTDVPPDPGSGSVSGSVTVMRVGARGDDGPDMPEFLDEVALRRMLHGAVEQIEPADGVLDHLHRAVPVRRARRRQAVVGMAAAALLIGTAVPAFVHVANSDGSNAPNPAIAGHGEQAQGGNGMESGSGSAGKDNGGGIGGQNDGDPNHPVSTSSPSDGQGQSGDGDPTGGVSDPAATIASSAPACDPEQLGVASAETGAAGADGTVYGTFRIANVSGKECSVSSGGSVGFQALGAADPAKIAVVQHAAGDAAGGLPDPSRERAAVELKPSMAYEVKFAWVPKDTCPTIGGSASPTPTEGAGGAGGAGGSAVAGGAGTGSGDGAADTAAQLGGDGGGGGGLLDGSVSVTHTPQAGAPVAEAKIANACAGTIYRTGVLAPTR
ncbi:hypothetical protein [Streptomyces sp. NPDC014734]|uniref:hypothetical protein n=1 Tax=Streptomyces sp. NPDC014734 TaxID=3364886 RepID=UPI0036F64B49